MAKATKRTDWKGVARKVALGAVGAAALTFEEWRTYADRCVERGEKLEPRIRQTLGRVRKEGAKARTRAGKWADGLGAKVESRVRGWRRALPFATRHDVAELVKRVDALTKRLPRNGRAPKAQAAPATA